MICLLSGCSDRFDDAIDVRMCGCKKFWVHELSLEYQGYWSKILTILIVGSLYSRA
jgi:hypothetical protein